MVVLFSKCLYLLFGLVAFASIAQTRPIVSNEKHEAPAGIISARSPSPRFIHPHTDVHTIFSDLGLNLDLDKLRETLQHHILDHMKGYHNDDNNNHDDNDKDTPSNARPENTNETTVTPDETHEDKGLQRHADELAENIIKSVTSSLQAAFDDSDEVRLRP
ncbi:hypothetical protein VTN00DRAFT_4351 [Thermoascus crustaceus]|uniref:uncharacterized protein n=1 Tax=Thermoascus crustaceus TaxID=5088 RepID=UPI003742DE6D